MTIYPSSCWCGRKDITNVPCDKCGAGCCLLHRHVEVNKDNPTGPTIIVCQDCMTWSIDIDDCEE